MAFKMKYKNLEEVVDGLKTASKTHAKQAEIVEGHIKDMGKGSTTKMAGSPQKGYVSAAQRKAVHATKADGGAGNPNKLLGDLDKDGELSSYEANRQKKIEENTKKNK